MRWLPLAAILFLASAGPLTAQTPIPKHGAWFDFWTCAKTCPGVGCCPDDYARKPCPLILTTRGGGPDDYCRKPMPCVADLLRCGGPVDYCRKPMPTLLCPPLSSFLRCAPPVASCVPCK
jgi:hypothetical protein